MIDPKTGIQSTLEEIYSALKNIIQSATDKGLGLGVMTSAHRDSWYEVFAELSKSN